MLDVWMPSPVRRLAVAVLALGLLASAPGARRTPFDASIATFAGSGAAGFADGDARNASFVMPAGLAYASDGTLYVADAGAQRIRAIAAEKVRTIAGSGVLDADGLWVAGGYRDGPALEARFNLPLAVAVDAHNRLFVADAGNHAIRLIAGGSVSTFAGSATESGNADGTLAMARFAHPQGVAFDRSGNLYVADYGNGVRKIDASGNVTTVFRARDVFGVATGAGLYDTLYIATIDGIVEIRSSDGAEFHFLNRFGGDGLHRLYAADASDLGVPYAIAAWDHLRFVYSELWSGSIRYYNSYSGNAAVVAGNRGTDAINADAGLNDGAVRDAAVSQPLGLAFGAGGALYVADAGNRRIRIVSNLHPDEAFVPNVTALSLPPSTANGVPVLLIGSSFVDVSGIRDDSMAREIDVEAAARERHTRTQTVVFAGSSLPAILSYLREIVAISKNAKVVVVLLDRFMMEGYGASWKAQLKTALSEANADLRANGIALTIAYQPLADEIAWDEYPVRLLAPDFWHQIELNNGGEDPAHIDHDAALAVLSDTGATVVDLFPIFIAAEKEPTHRPLYGTVDHHLSDYGRAVAAKAIGSQLAGLRAVAP